MGFRWNMAGFIVVQAEYHSDSCDGDHVLVPPTRQTETGHRNVWSGGRDGAGFADPLPGLVSRAAATGQTYRLVVHVGFLGFGWDRSLQHNPVGLAVCLWDEWNRVEHDLFGCYPDGNFRRRMGRPKIRIDRLGG